MMKKIIALTILIFSMTLVTGCSARENQIDKISANSAKAIALADAGVLADDVTTLTVEWKNNRGQSYYDVDFTVNGMKYDYDIDAVTGAVQNWEVEPTND